MSEVEIGVLGAGAWGTALAVLWAQEGKRVALWARDFSRAAKMREVRENIRLPNVRLPDGLAVVSDFPAADVLVAAVPMQGLRWLLTALPESDAALVLCCKGLEAISLLLAPEVVAALRPRRRLAVLTGPNFAHEVAAGLPAAAVLAAEDGEMRRALVRALSSGTLRLYGSGDVLGAALGGAAKNVIAIAAGVVMGAGLGENARAALITRGLAEMGRLVTALGGRAETVSGLSGLGDLLLTCTGDKSRNYSLGFELGRGDGLAEILAGRSGVTEGVATAPALLARADAVGVEMPIAEAVVGLLAGTMGVAETMGALMGRALRDE
jgi:glycerol-3-phosphate dehydrogenase (NAD(P)+)